MAARPSSPTSLLWAHQLKREHGVLLKRMQDVEASSDRQSKRLKATETTSTDSIADIAALAQRVQALEDAGLEERLSNIENDIKGKVHDLKADSKALAVQIAAIQRDVEAHGQKTTLLERIGELEKGLETFERSVQQIGRRVEQAQLDSIKTQLEGLRRQVEAEGETMSMLSESVTALESAKDMLKASNERLAAELGAITRKNAATGTADVISAPNACAAATSISTSAPAPLESKKKSHKWNGGGADRDIIVSGLASSPIVPTTRGQRVKEMPSREREGPAPAKFRSEPKQKETSKTIPPHLRAEGSARPTAATTSSTSTGPRAAGRELGSSRARRVILQPPVAVGDLGGAILQQAPPQPKKRTETPRWTAEEAWTQGRSTRRGGHTKHILAKNEPDTESKEMPLSSIPPKGRPGKNLFSSSSSAIAAQQPEDAVAPVRKRRRVPQDD